jgi:hypothetical protein
MTETEGRLNLDKLKNLIKNGLKSIPKEDAAT